MAKYNILLKFSFNLPLSSCCASPEPMQLCQSLNVKHQKRCWISITLLQQSPVLLIQNGFFTFLLFQENQHMDSAQRLQKEAIFRFNIFSQTVWGSYKIKKLWKSIPNPWQKRTAASTKGICSLSLCIRKDNRLHKMECWSKLLSDLAWSVMFLEMLFS